MTLRVANGDKLESKAVCQPLVWRIQEWEFQFKLRTLKHAGSDMVLGVNWMSQFDLVLFDFIQGCLKFKDKNGKVELKSEMPEHFVQMMEMGKIETPCRVLEVISQFPQVFDE